MPNLSRIIDGHNSKILAGEAVVAPKRPWGNCSCPRRTREAQACPLGGECLEENIVYKATVKLEEGTAVEDEVQDKTYLGLCSTEWKERLGNHKQPFKKVKRRGETCLSTSILGCARRRSTSRSRRSSS